MKPEDFLMASYRHCCCNSRDLSLVVERRSEVPTPKYAGCCCCGCQVDHVDFFLLVADDDFQNHSKPSGFLDSQNSAPTITAGGWNTQVFFFSNTFRSSWSVSFRVCVRVFLDSILSFSTLQFTRTAGKSSVPFDPTIPSTL